MVWGVLGTQDAAGELISLVARCSSGKFNVYFAIFMSIFSKQVSFQEFKEYLEALTKRERRNFIISHYDKMLAMREADKLNYLCELGFIGASVPLLKCGDKKQIFAVYKRYYGENQRAVIKFKPNEEVKLMEYAGKHYDITKYLLEETDIFDEYLCSHPFFITAIYKSAVPRVFEYLFRWNINNIEPLYRQQAMVLFSLASKDLICEYGLAVGRIHGEYPNVTMSMIKALLIRTDLSDEDKDEIMTVVYEAMEVDDFTKAVLHAQGLSW